MNHGPTADVEASLDAGRRGRRQAALFWGAAVLSLLALAPFGPFLNAFFHVGCPLKEMTGYPCPTCGTTRAALALARFDVLEALRYPLPTLGWIAFIVGGLSTSAWVLSGRDLPPLPRRIPAWAIAAGFLALLLNWVWSIHTGV